MQSKALQQELIKAQQALDELRAGYLLSIRELSERVKLVD